MAALLLHAPECLPIVQDIWNSASKTGASGKISESVFGEISCNVSLEQGERVLSALQAIQDKLGWNVVFEDRQINFLIAAWRRFSQPRQLPRM